jgi:hypothetical protein
VEVLTWALCARDELYKKMRIADPGNQVHLFINGTPTHVLYHVGRVI